jgi:hypothetical protein
MLDFHDKDEKQIRTYAQGTIPQEKYRKFSYKNDILLEIVEDFLGYTLEQELFVKETNKIFDQKSEKTLFKSFYDDVIYDLLPKKYFLSQDQEQRLSRWSRFVRLFCVEYDLSKQHIVFN